MTGIITSSSLRPCSIFQRFIRLTATIFASLMLASIQAAKAEQYGPFDYYDPPKGSLSLVERPHFGAITQERAKRGDWCWYWSDLDYTLRVFPNHPRAIEAMAEYLKEHQACPKDNKAAALKDIVAGIEEGDWREKNADYYYEIGIKFRPKQTAARILYGKYLYKMGRLKDALKQLSDAEKLDPASGETHYYMGLAYADSGDYLNAKSHAIKAHKLGYKVDEKSPDLRGKLVKAGVWTDKDGK